MKKNQRKIPVERRNLVYILAPSYSGSTLLTFLLSTHKSISTIGELKASRRYDLETYRCSCGSFLRDCNFWKIVTKEMQKVDFSFSLNDFKTHFRGDTFLCDRLLRAGVRSKVLEFIRNSMLRLFPGCRCQLQHILERNRHIIEIICSQQQGHMFLDGSKDPIRLRLLNSAGYWNLKVIYLIRDGRGATNSYMRHYDVPMDKASREWRRAHRECIRVVRELENETYITIHYENLCKDPHKTMTKIYDFLGLSTDSVNLRFRSFEHHILGNQMRLESPEEIKLDEKWKNSLTNCELEGFERTAGRLNRHYGYV